VPGTCVIGLQWGDEAKGKLVDLLTLEHDIVVRYQGGANAGHTVVAGDETYKVSLIPSGIFTPSVKSVIAGGVVINPPACLEEIDGLMGRGIQIGDNLMISDRSHAIFPWHMAEDKVLDGSTSDGENIGTTQRGIGPCYRDKVGRSYAIRMGDLYKSSARQQIEHVAQAKTRAMASGNGETALQFDGGKIADDYLGYAKRLEPFVRDTTAFLLDAVDQDQRILFEGAQGSLLDVDHGTYPYVTSSNSSGVGVSSGSGVPGRFLSKMIGVVKAYSTRVGGGPFPTEQDNDIGQRLRDRGNEYGTVTKRPRRCGWFDAVAVRYTARLSGVDCLAVMLLDVLAKSDEISICTAYEIDGERTVDFPSHVEDLRRAVPVYETVPGWQEELTEMRSLEEMPQAARSYLDRISELIGRPIEVVSVGPDRKQTIFAKDAPVSAP